MSLSSTRTEAGLGKPSSSPPGIRHHLEEACRKKPFFSYLETVCPRSTRLLGNSTPRTKLLRQPGSAPLTPSFLASCTAEASARMPWGISACNARGTQPGVPAPLRPTHSPWQHGCCRLGAKWQCSPTAAPPAVPGHPCELACLDLCLAEPNLNPLMGSSNSQQPFPFFSSSP